MLNKKNILITGGTGLIGQALVDEILSKDTFDLRIQVRDAKKARAHFSQYVDLDKIGIIECDFNKCSNQELDNLTKECCAIIHLAGLVHKPEASYQDYELLNVRTTEQLVRAAQNNNVDTFVFLSSAAVYGDGPFSSVAEDGPVNPKTPYAVSKINCEQILERATNIPRVIVLRPAMVYGEGDRGNLIKLIQTIARKRYIQIGQGNTLKSLIYSRDLAKVICTSLEKLPSGKYVLNAANPEAISIKNLSSEIWYALGHKGSVPSVPQSLLFAGVKITDKIMPGRLPVNEEQLVKLTTETTVSTYKLETMVDFKPQYTIPAALRAEIKWAKKSGLI